MNVIRPAFLSLLILCVSIRISFSQPAKSVAIRIRADYQELKKHPNSKEKQLIYLKDFPSNKQLFMTIFEPDDHEQVYLDGYYEYIAAFVELSKFYPNKVIDKCVNIGKDLIWEADATGQMQHSIVDLGNKHPNIFVTKLKSLTGLQVSNLITFLADVENHQAYPEYQQLIESLRTIGETKLADKFIAARLRREKIKHH